LLFSKGRLAEDRRAEVARSTIAQMLKAQGIPPAPERPTSWRTFLRAGRVLSEVLDLLR
jgi:hypothetical protein